MPKFFLILLFVFFSFSLCSADEYNSFYPPEYPNGGYLEIGGGKNPDSSWVELGVIGSPSEFIEYRASLSYLGAMEDEAEEKSYFAGFNIGTRLKFSSFITPFIGAGIFTGYAFEDLTADNDKIDNDGDGIVDEENEQKEVVDDIIFSFYPEAGFYLQFENNSKIYFSSKYMISSEDETGSFFLFTIGFSFTYE
jgi:hypothetical protein